MYVNDGEFLVNRVNNEKLITFQIRVTLNICVIKNIFAASYVSQFYIYIESILHIGI